MNALMLEESLAESYWRRFNLHWLSIRGEKEHLHFT